MKVVLYYAPYTCAAAPYLTLTEAGCPFEVRLINMRKKQQMSPEYLKINPKHKVPTLVVDARPLTENVAMHLWVARNFPEAELLPKDPWQELKAISMLAWVASGIHPNLSRINSPAKVCDLPGSEDNIKKHAAGPVMEAFAIADDLLAGQEYFFKKFTAPDAHFFWAMRRGQQLGLDFGQFKNCMAHHERMLARPSVKTLVAFERSVLDQFDAAA